MKRQDNGRWDYPERRGVESFPWEGFDALDRWAQGSQNSAKSRGKPQKSEGINYQVGVRLYARGEILRNLSIGAKGPKPDLSKQRNGGRWKRVEADEKSADRHFSGTSESVESSTLWADGSMAPIVPTGTISTSIRGALPACAGHRTRRQDLHPADRAGGGSGPALRG